MATDKTYKTYVAIHSHRFGVSMEIFQTNKDIIGIEDKKIAKKLGFDFEPGIEEFIEIFPIDLNDIKRI